MGHKTHLSPRTRSLVAQYLALELYVGHIAINLVDVEQAAAVDVLVGEVVEQVVHRAYTQLPSEQCCPLWPHSLQILYVARRQVVHDHIVPVPPPPKQMKVPVQS